MNLQALKNRSSEKGFTIVELLIVIVVIAILAAITIVAYTNITARANKSAAVASAKAVADVAQNFQGNYGVYPTTKAQFVSGTTGAAGAAEAIAKLPSDITFVTTAPTETTVTPKTVSVVPHGTPTAGFTITYWDYDAKTFTGTRTVGDVSGTAQTALAN